MNWLLFCFVKKDVLWRISRLIRGFFIFKTHKEYSAQSYLHSIELINWTETAFRSRSLKIIEKKGKVMDFISLRFIQLILLVVLMAQNVGQVTRA